MLSLIKNKKNATTKDLAGRLTNLANSATGKSRGGSGKLSRHNSESAATTSSTSTKSSSSLNSTSTNNNKAAPVICEPSNIPPTAPGEQQQPELVLNSTGDTVLLQSGGGLSFGFTAMEVTAARPPSRTTSMQQHHQPERPSSRSSNSGGRRTNQPRLGVGMGASSYLFEDDPGIMSEVETSSTRFRRTTSKERSSMPPPAASSGASRSYKARIYEADDPGIMSEAETSSTARARKSKGSSSILNGGGGSRNSISMGVPSQQQQRSVQFRHPVAQFRFEMDDPGIMSEADTAATSGGRRRQRQHRVTSEHRAHSRHVSKKDSLPIVRTPSKTLERPLGLVFLVYRGETKRAVLPNEITSLDTVKALFVRSFGKTLTMDYMYTPRVHIYIHDGSKDIFYQLEDLTEIRDRTILKLYEADSLGRGPSGLGASGLPPITNADDEAAAIVAAQSQQSSLQSAPPPSEPEYVDSRHVKAMKVLNRVQREYEMASQTLPRNAFSALEQERLESMLTEAGLLKQQQQASLASSGDKRLGERSKTLGPGFMYGYNSSGKRVESGYVSSPDATYDETPAIVPSRFSALPEGRYYPRPESTEEAKERMMHMEAQLSQLTGMVERALKNKKLGKKTVSFDKSVTYSDDPQPQSIMKRTSQQQQQSSQSASSSTSAAVQQLVHNHSVHHHNMAPHSQHVSSASSASSNSHTHHNHAVVAAAMNQGEMYGNLRRLHRSARDLKQEVKVLRRLTQLQSMAMKDLVQDTYIKLREACMSYSTSQSVAQNNDPELWRVAQDEDTFAKELNDLLQTIGQLETKVEQTRSGVINKKNKISLVDVEAMASTLSKCSKTVTLLKQAFPTLEANLKSNLKDQHQAPAEKRRMTEDFLKRTPDRMENIWRRCKKLTGTLVTLKRLASVQEQRFHPGSSSLDASVSLSPTPPTDLSSTGSASSSSRSSLANGGGSSASSHTISAGSSGSSLDDLLDTLHNHNGNHAGSRRNSTKSNNVMSASAVEQSPHRGNSGGRKARPSSSEITDDRHLQNGVTGSDAAAKPGVKPAPPPPPRSSSAFTNNSKGERRNSTESSSSAESSSQESQLSQSNKNPPPVPSKPVNVDIKTLTAKARQDALEQRHIELLSRQKQLQEQYQRLQNMSQKSASPSASGGSSAGKKEQSNAVATTNGGSNSSSSSATSSLSSNSSSSASTARSIPPPPAPSDTNNKALPLTNQTKEPVKIVGKMEKSVAEPKQTAVVFPQQQQQLTSQQQEQQQQQQQPAQKKAPPPPPARVNSSLTTKTSANPASAQSSSDSKPSSTDGKANPVLQVSATTTTTESPKTTSVTTTSTSASSGANPTPPAAKVNSNQKVYQTDMI